MDTQNSPKKSPRNSAKSKRDANEASEASRPPRKNFDDSDEEKYMDRSFDMVARVRAAKEAARREMESFGDISEYEITTLQGMKNRQPEKTSQAALDFGPDDKPEAD